MEVRSFENRFWEKVDRAGPIPEHATELGACWVWTGATTAPGWHGMTFWNNRRIVAHRAAWVLENGPIPDGLSVLHRCDNAPCVRTSHLILGTQRENMQDAGRKGRMGQTKHKTACVHGHAYTPENTYRGPKTGRRQCVTCRATVVRTRVRS